jgi:hypothetical protein
MTGIAGFMAHDDPRVEILCWSSSPRDAWDVVVSLNDTCFVDGRDATCVGPRPCRMGKRTFANMEFAPTRLR